MFDVRIFPEGEYFSITPYFRYPTSKMSCDFLIQIEYSKSQTLWVQKLRDKVNKRITKFA